jgi:Predicted ATPases
VESGSISLACSKRADQSSADILGLYGQNGSGKTTLIEALSILKTVLSGQSIPSDYANYITVGQGYAYMSYLFEIRAGAEIFEAKYSFNLAKRETNAQSNIEKGADDELYHVAIENEELSISGNISGRKIKWQTLMDTSSPLVPFKPSTKYTELAGSSKETRQQLMVNRYMTNEGAQSFIFSRKTLQTIKGSCEIPEYMTIIDALVQFGNFGLFVIDTKSAGLINLNAALPFFFRLDTERSLSIGKVAIKLEEPSVIPRQVCEGVQRAISNMNTVLEQIIPGLNVRLKELGVALLRDGQEGCSVELVSVRGGKTLPLRYESEGIKKIISILQLLIVMYNNEGVTVAIDELDAGIFEYLLGELLKIIAESGRGQLIFTSHNLRPLETIDKKYIFFSTNNPQNRYIQLESVQANNNLRYFYYRDLTLGGQKEELYDRTNNYEIALSLREIGEFYSG